MSRIGKKPINLPKGVEFSLNNESISVKGAKGEINLALPLSISVKGDGNEISISYNSEKGENKAIYGTIRSLIANMVQGVSEGFTKELEIRGVGFRATVKGSNLDLNLGKSHPILHPIPEGIKVQVEGDTKIKVEGIDKQQVGQFASDIRAYHPPEPYKGKGVRYTDEYVRRKTGKSVQ